MNGLMKHWSRWFVAPLLLAALLAWGVSPAYPDNALSAQTNPVATKLVVAPVMAVNDAGVQEIKDRLKELESKERQDYALVLEGQRKTMDWWFSFLAVLTAIMAIFGALIPFLMARKDREIIGHDKNVIEQDKAQIKEMLDEVKGMKVDAENDLNKIHQHAAEAENTLRDFQSGASSVNNEKIRAAVETVEQDKSSDYLLKLRAEAIAASQEKKSEKAYKLWVALAELASVDASARFNAGYWAHELGGQAQGEEKLRWLKLAGKHYEQALNIKPDLHEAANNWGLALEAEARALPALDLSTARALWQQAGEKYQLALSIKPDDHEAANNCGLALAAEAGALSALDLTAARTLWQQAREKYQLALSIKPDLHEAANNWGNALAVEARALSAIDLTTARALWQQAGEKYLMALSIKPDLHEAANNWGSALLSEARAIAVIDAEGTKRLRDQAEQLLLAHAEVAPGMVAYNLACMYGLCGDVQNCLKWLRVAQEHKTLVSCEHLNGDNDLDLVRNSPEFIEWFKQVCP